MKVLQINEVPYGSIGKIALGIKNVSKKKGIDVDIACGYSSHPIDQLKECQLKVGGFFSKGFHLFMKSLFGVEGIYSFFSTIKLLKYIKRQKIDLLHFHNVHGYYLCLPLLFRFIKRNDIPIVWTFHDCWPFTGKCYHYQICRCNKWKTLCFKCPKKHEKYDGFLDSSKIMYKLKKKWFLGIRRITIVAPSGWLEKEIRQSFLNCYPTQVIHNGINLNLFKYEHSNFKIENNCVDKYVILGVAMGWTYNKGLDIFCELAELLDEKYQIVLVGTNDKVDKCLPKKIISIHRTQNISELAKIYSAADIFINPTREDTYPTVNLESIACGTPVISFNTGGSSESISNDCGMVIEECHPKELVTIIDNMIKNISSYRSSCINQRKEFDEKSCFSKYAEVYKSMLGDY